MPLLALALAIGPALAQTAGLTASSSSSLFSQSCSSAKAVHDMRCANYTGFTPRAGSDASVGAGLAPADGPRLGLRAPGERATRELDRGMASWYGPGFHGRPTASGERFNENELTAAHKTLPFGTRVLVHNPRNGRQVVVRINDRGPFVRGRVIDVSRAAARELGMKQSGRVPVVLREVLPASGDTVVE